MKNFKLILFAMVLCTLNVSAQKVAKVTISTKATVAEVLNQCKEAGKEEGYGSRDYNVEEGKLTLWQHVGRLKPFEFYAYVSAGNKDGITTFTIRIPYNPSAIANYKKCVKKIVKHLELPEMMTGEFTYEIE